MFCLPAAIDLSVPMSCDMEIKTWVMVHYTEWQLGSFLFLSWSCPVVSSVAQNESAAVLSSEAADLWFGADFHLVFTSGWKHWICLRWTPFVHLLQSALVYCSHSFITRRENGTHNKQEVRCGDGSARCLLWTLLFIWWLH